MAACSNKHVAVVRLLLEAGADPNVKTKTMSPKTTALHKAAESKSGEIVSLLLQHGADPNAKRDTDDSKVRQVIATAIDGERFMTDLLHLHFTPGSYSTAYSSGTW